jgi:hypothetical protein
MISIPLTPSEILELLTHHGVLEDVSLVNHRWLVDRLEMCGSPEDLAYCGIVLEKTPSGPVLWSANGWKDELVRRARAKQISDSHRQSYRPLTRETPSKTNKLLDEYA